MRTPQVILVIAVLTACVLGLLWFLPLVLQSHYIRLQHKSPEYYAKLAAACDFILAKQPPGTNEIAWIPVTEPSLPAAVKDLHPLKLRVYPHGIWMLLDSDSRNGIGLEWTQQPDDPNVWKLAIVAEGLGSVLYSVKR